MSAVISISTGKAYGVSRVCRVWGLGRASVYRDLRPLPAEPAPRRRPGPRGAMSDADLVERIKQVITDSRFHGEGHRKIRARLRCKGIRTSKARVLRLMRENGLCAKPCHGPAHGPRAHDGTIIPDNIDEMWGTDMTGTVPGTGRQVAVFIAVDHCPAGCAGGHSLSISIIPKVLWLAVHRPRLPERDCLAGREILAVLCPRSRRQRPRRAIHSNPEGKPAPGQNFRHHRGTPGRPAKAQGGLQRRMADPAARTPFAKPVQM